MAPVRLTGFAASGALLAAAGVLMARERRRDLRLRVLRGVGPTRLAGLLGVTALPAVLIGTAVGAAVAVLAVVTVGPTPELEPAALRARPRRHAGRRARAPCSSSAWSARSRPTAPWTPAPGG